MALNNDKYTYRVIWSKEDQSHVGLCAEFPDLKWKDESPSMAFKGIQELVKDTVISLEKNNQKIPSPISLKPFSNITHLAIQSEYKRRQKKLIQNETSSGVFYDNATISVSDSNMAIESEAEMLELYQSIESSLPGKSNKIIQLISSGENEGTSTITRSLARVISRKFNKSVLIFDANVYRPSQHYAFSINPDEGWLKVIENGDAIRSAFKQIGNSSLFVSPVSQNSTSLADMFISKRIHDLWTSIQERFSLVIVDSPAYSTAPDGLVISQYVDGIILIIETEKTRWLTLNDLKNKLLKNNTPIIGMAMNKRQFHIPQFIYDRL